MTKTLHLSASPLAPPRVSSAASIALTDIESGDLRDITELWHGWRGIRYLPSHTDMSVGQLGRHLPKVSLIRVIDGGTDYEFRVIGDTHVQIYGSTFQGKRMTDVIAVAPKVARFLKTPCDLVRTTRQPHAFRGVFGQEPSASFGWFEACYLPFGDRIAGVDHILNAAVYKAHCPPP